MANLRNILALPVLTALMAGCATTQPMTTIKASPHLLDYKPEVVSPPKLDLRSRMPRLSSRTSVADTKLYSFRATGMALRLALSQLAAVYHLNIIVDQNVGGYVTVDLHDLPLHQVLQSILDPLGLAWKTTGTLIHVSKLETRTFTVNYLRMERQGRIGTSSTSSMTGGGGGGSTTTITQQDQIAFWKELQNQLKEILAKSASTGSGAGHQQTETTVQSDKKTGKTVTLTRPIHESAGRLIIDPTSGTIQVTTSHERMRHVEDFLARVKNGIERQVYISVRVVEVTLNHDHSLGIDWSKLNLGSLALSTNVNINNPVDGLGALPATLTGNYVRTFTGPFNAAMNIDAVLQALKQQGQVQVVSQPRIRTMNNQTAIVRVGTERTFFSTTTINNGTALNPILTTSNTPTTVTDGLLLSVTPQISARGNIMLDVNPVLTRITGVDVSPDGLSNAPRLDIKQASTMVRVHNNQTVVVGGLIQTLKSNTNREVPLAGDVPLLGNLFGANYNRTVRQELVIFITPHIVP